MSIKKLSFFILVASIIMLVVGPTQALPLAQGAAPGGATVPYAGQLAGDDGLPVADGAFDFSFALYAAESGGEPLWSEAQKGVPVKDGSFAVSLGSANSIPQQVLNTGAVWLAVSVRGPGETNFTALAPRQSLSAAAPTAPASPNNGAACPHDHFGEAWTGTGRALILSSNYPDSDVLCVINDATSGDGIRAYSAGAAVSDAAVEGLNLSSGSGVYGNNTGSGYGVYGSSTGAEGVHGETSADGWAGVAGINTSTEGSGVGVWGEARTDNDSVGVHGIATATSGANYGVVGVSNSSNGYGVKGASGWVGVYGDATGSSNAVGVAGHADNESCISGIGGCYGVQGISKTGSGASGSTTSGIGVKAESTGGGVGLYVHNQMGGNLIEAWSGMLPADRRFYVSGAGEVYADGTFHAGGADLAEMLPAADGLEPGDVLVVGADGKLARSTQPYQPSVVGVYSTRPGFVGGASDDVDMSGKIPLAIVGIVPVKVTVENGPIQAGDLLVASSTPGHAMRASDNPAPGAVIGKSLGSLDSGSGVVEMLAMLR